MCMLLGCVYVRIHGDPAWWGPHSTADRDVVVSEHPVPAACRLVVLFESRACWTSCMPSTLPATTVTRQSSPSNRHVMQPPPHTHVYAHGPGLLLATHSLFLRIFMHFYAFLRIFTPMHTRPGRPHPTAPLLTAPQQLPPHSCVCPGPGLLPR